MNTVIVNDGTNEETIEEVIAHQIGTGYVAVIKHSGVQRIIANFKTIDIIPDQEDQEVALKRSERAYSKPEE